VCTADFVSLDGTPVGTRETATMPAGTQMGFGKAKHAVVDLSSPIAAIVSEPHASTPRVINRITPPPSLQPDLALPVAQGAVGTPGFVASNQDGPVHLVKDNACSSTGSDVEPRVMEPQLGIPTSSVGQRRGRARPQSSDLNDKRTASRATCSFLVCPFLMCPC
jgi:hypothetical protein